MGIIHDIITVFTVYQLQSPFTALFSKEFMKTFNSYDIFPGFLFGKGVIGKFFG